MWKFLHAADIHLDSPLRRLSRCENGPISVLREATRRALVNLVDLAIEEQVAFVIVAGDLYDGDWDDARTGLFMVSQIARLREANIQLFAIAGNHDAANRMTRNIRLPENAQYLSHRRPQTIVLDTIGAAIHGQGFENQAVTENLARGYPARRPDCFNIGVLHTSIDGREGHDNYAPCTLADLVNKEYDYWALGHIHARELLCSDPIIAFSGNLQGRHIRESGPKGAYLVTVNGHRATAEFRALDAVRWATVEIDISSLRHTDEVLSTLQTQIALTTPRCDGRPLVVRVELTGSGPLHHSLAGRPDRWDDQFRAIVSDQGAADVWLEQVKFLTRAPQSQTRERALEGPWGEVDRIMERAMTDDAVLDELARELRDLRARLPDDLTSSNDGIRVDDPVWLRATLASVASLLHERLRAGADSP
ncbi:MAG: DNA repair exonuclease [Planctomycetes bacterium]|nr:DNA repair exonuclease [Planctomycetota bacterium]